MVRASRGAGWPDGVLPVLRRLARRPRTVARAAIAGLRGAPLLCGFDAGGWSRHAPATAAWHSWKVFHQVEQTPDLENRVCLATERDRFGCPLIEVHWRWSADDDARLARAQALMAEEFRRSGLGTFAIARRDGRPDVLRPAGTHHIMGTTRMHADPRRGVVDADGRVHGLQNLFVAGSSVFPTGGYANPTLTIVAMAIRLADHLKSQLRAERQAVVPVDEAALVLAAPG